MNIAEALLHHARRVHELCTGKGLDFGFMGGIALNVWAVPAPTFDLDFSVALPPERIQDLLKWFDDDGYSTPAAAYPNHVGPHRFPKTSVQFVFEKRMLDIDIFFAESTYQQSALQRRREVELAQAFRTWVLLPEDLLLHKAIANRKKDRVAIERLLAVQQELEWSYVGRWAMPLGVADRIRAALKDAGLDPHLLP